MTERGDGQAGAAGGPSRHVPVLLGEVCTALDATRGGIFVDGTFGAGGYTRAIIDAHPRNVVIAIDRDPDALAGGRSDGCTHGAQAHAGGRPVRRTSTTSPPRRGSTPSTAWFSTSACPRCSSTRPAAASRSGRTVPSTCAWSGAGRARPIWSTDPRKANSPTSSTISARSAGRGPWRARSSRRRRRAPIETTLQLADLVSSIIRQEPGGIHPATRVFQALRIAVNDELGELVRALHAAERILKPGGQARGRDLPFPRGPDREAVLRGADGQGRRRRPATCRPSSPRGRASRSSPVDP